MNEMVRAMDWSRTPLGPMESWPQALRFALDVCLSSRFPMFVWWGPDLINIYNDAYAPMLGKRHPQALGRSARETWADIWSVIGPQAEAVMTRGEATWNERVQLVMERQGYTEDTWFTWSYSPIRDDSGRIAGLFCACTEETGRVLAERERDSLLKQVESERGRLAEAFAQAPSLVAVLRGPTHVFEFANERYVRLLGGRELRGHTVADALPEIREQGFLDLLDRVYASGEPFVGTGVPAKLRRSTDGSLEERRFDFVYQPLRAADGTVSSILAHGVDVTERHRAEIRDRFLLTLDEAIRPLTEPSEIVAAYARLLGKHLGADRCAYADVEEDQNTFNLTGDYNQPGVPSIVGRYRFIDFGTEVLRLMHEDRPYVVADVDTHQPPVADLSSYRQTLIKAVVCVPLHKAGRFVAAMAVHQRVPREWSADEVDLVRHVAARCWESIERARVERSLRESEERFRAAFEQAAVGIAHVALDGRWLRVNQKLCNILGYSREELVRLTFQDITHPDDLPNDLDGLRRLRAGKTRTYVAEKRYVHKEGHSVWTGLTVSVVGNVLEPASAYFVSVVEDISERKAAEQRLREESEVVEMISRVGRALAAELDSQKLIQTITDATTELTGAQFAAFFHNTTDEKGQAMWLYTLSGAPREAFAAFPLPRGTHLFGPTLRGEGVIRIDDVLKDPRYGRNAPYNGMPKGHLPVRSYLAVPVVSRYGDVLGGLFFGHSDVGVFNERAERIVTGVAAQAAVALDNARLFDEVRRADAAKDALLASEQAARTEAERASRMKDEFLATLSHELRTPLNAILGWAGILKHGTSAPQDLAQGLDTIERNARAQTQIIEDLLDMSRIISGKVRLDVQRISLEPILRAAVDTVTPAANAKGVRIQAVLDPLAGPISGDPARLQQIFWNLLTNAIKFTPRGGRVQVVLERVNSHLEISVIDTGEGIHPDFLPHVFERFRQADATTTRRHGGLGLGLSIVKQLIELHGGSVRAKSMGEGQGSTFTVSLPLAVIHPDSETDADRRHPRQAADAPALVADLCAEIAGVKVLVVDDEPDARALVKRLLEDCKAIVVTAASAAEAMEKLQAERPDVLVSDIGMPVEDGYSLIRRVRALGNDRGGNVPAVALTAYARAEDRMRSIRAGFQMHVPKPVEPAELITMVASLAGRG